MSGIIGQNVGRSSGLKKAIVAAGNTPYFLAHRGADGCSGDGCTQDTSDNVFTKAQFNGERLDTDNCYDTSNYRFTPNKAGKYFIFAQVKVGEYSDRLVETIFEFRFNGNQYGDMISKRYPHSEQSSGYTADATYYIKCTQIITFNGSSDYVEAWVKCDQNANYARVFGGSQSRDGSYFGGFFIGA